MLSVIRCVIENRPVGMGSRGHRHSVVVARFEEFMAANLDRPIRLAEMCRASGVSERTLRVCCQEHLGMGPVRYLWLQRMHLAHRALILANPTAATVTEVATGFGFCELGRFSVEYRRLFGESPSTSLRRPPENRRIPQGRRFTSQPNLHSAP